MLTLSVYTSICLTTIPNSCYDYTEDACASAPVN